MRTDELTQQRKLVFAPAPVYPKLAIQAHISGTVKLAVLVGEDGSVGRIRLISGHPFLVPAAMDAVKKWEYEPTWWRGAPVAVLTTVTIRFQIGPSPDSPGQTRHKQAVIHVSLARH